MIITKKQLEILMAVKQGNPDGEPCTVYDIMDIVPYDCRRDAILHCMKPLIVNGYVMKLGTVKRGTSTQPQMTFGLGPEGVDII